MSETRAALAALMAQVRGLAHAPRLLQPQPSTVLVAKMAAPEPASALPPVDHMAGVKRRILAALRGEGVRSIAPRDLRDAAWLLWDENEPLSGTAPTLLDSVVEQARNRASVRRSLIEAWLRDFAPRLTGIAPTGIHIREIIRTVKDAKMDIWRRADQEVRLFEAEAGPREFAQRLLTDGAPLAETMASFGFAEPIRLTGGYMRQVSLELLAIAPHAIRGPHGPSTLQRMLPFFVSDGQLRFRDPEARGALVNGLLGAWIDGWGEPAGEVEKQVQRFLLEHLKDPRIAPTNWNTARDAARSLIRRWLTKASLKAFFSLIAEHAKDEHWEYRSAFWGAYLEHGAITDAWLALGARTLASARTVPDLGGAYGRLVGAGSDQSVLLMRVGNLVFSEWSHNGKLRAWPADSPRAPPLGRPEYSRSDIVGDGMPFPPNPMGGSGNTSGGGISHMGSLTGSWQGSAAELIRRKAGIALGQSDWMPARYRRIR